jgi:hypothetical protein
MNDMTDEMLRKAARHMRYGAITKKELLAGMLQAMVAEANERLEFLQGITALAKSVAVDREILSQLEKEENASPRVPLSDATIIPHHDCVHLWRVTGQGGVFYPTKMAAEIAARQMFPDETEDKRYARISYSNFVKEG